MSETPEVPTLDLIVAGNVYAGRADELPGAAAALGAEFIGNGAGEVIETTISPATDNGSGGATRWGASVSIVVRVPL